MRVQGTVKWFSDEKGYGFIERDDKQQDVFVHYSVVQNVTGGRVTLAEGERVDFEVMTSGRGPKAADVVRIGAR